MDSYVDMLSQRFNAGEMIKANGEAEALEIDRLKTQIEEYDKILQEMHRLNEKCGNVRTGDTADPVRDRTDRILPGQK
jgi:hypothetical protein